MAPCWGRLWWAAPRLNWAVTPPPTKSPAYGSGCESTLSKNRCKSGRKIHVNDSKLVYNTSAGLKELERSMLSLVAASGQWCTTLDELLDRVRHRRNEAAGYAWYAPPEGEAFPSRTGGNFVQLFAKSLRVEMERSATRCVHLCAQVVFERRFNQMIEATRNKGAALFSIAAMHLDHLLRTYGEGDLVIVCDRQGGREHYGSLLRLMFPELVA